MGRRSLSPILKQQLENLDKDAESRRSAMKILKSHVEDLDSKSLPLFISQLTGMCDSSLSSRDCIISLFEVLARSHGRKIVPHIEKIMSTIVKTLMSSSGSFPLQQSCSKVIPALARYSIEPSTPDYEKPRIIHSLCKPLCDMLMGTPDYAASGSALCLKALVECENWRSASSEIVNEMCLKIASALEEKPTQTSSHMGLAMSLASRNNLAIEAYSRLIVRSGIQMLTSGFADGNLNKRLTAIQMIKCYMKEVDSRSIFSEVEMIIDTMEQCQSDPMECVRGAAFEALRAAKGIYVQKCSVVENGFSSTVSINVGVRSNSDGENKNILPDEAVSAGGRRSLQSAESQTIHSTVEHCSSDDSPLAVEQASFIFNYRPARRKLWENENGGVNISLRDGLLSEVASCSSAHVRHLEDDQFVDGERCGLELFSGFPVKPEPDSDDRSNTPSPEVLPPDHNTESSRCFIPSRELMSTFHHLNDASSTSSTEKCWGCISEETHEIVESAGSDRNTGTLLPSVGCKHRTNNKDSSDGRDIGPISAHVHNSYTKDSEALYNLNASEKCGRKSGIGHASIFSSRALVNILFGFSFIFPVFIIFALWFDDRNEHFSLVPT